jgi:hypothetical protein
MLMVLNLGKKGKNKVDYQILNWNDFNPKQKPASVSVIEFVPLPIAIPVIGLVGNMINPQLAEAGIAQNSVVSALRPLIDLFQALSYPIAFLTLSAGMLMIIIGNRSKGIDMCKWAGVGYIGMQFVPGIMNMLAEVGDTMR